MASMSRFKMSQERLDAIKAELNYLETVREKEVAEKTKKKDDRNVIHNEDVLEQIERLNRNRAQMKESMEKSKNRQSKH